MKTTKLNDGQSNKSASKYSGSNYVFIHDGDGESEEQNRFDKNNISESDMDEILAIS